VNVSANIGLEVAELEKIGVAEGELNSLVGVAESMIDIGRVGTRVLLGSNVAISVGVNPISASISEDCRDLTSL